MSKKKPQGRRNRGGPTGAERQEQRRQRLEARRAEKAAALERRRRRERRERIVRWVAIASLAVFSIWFFFIRTQRPNEILGNRVELMSQAPPQPPHGEAPSYDDKPPVSGQHLQGVQPCGTYAQTMEDGLMVHILEHGAVGMLFKPELDPGAIESIEKFVGGRESDLFSQPYTEMKTPITVVSWGERMGLKSFDREAIVEYIDEFGGDAPESQQETCENESSQTFEAEPSPTPSPKATATPTPSPTETKAKKNK